MNNLIERVLETRRPKTKSFFSLHAEHHKKAQVDLTSFQAKRLGLKYLGFGRYGKIMIEPIQSPTGTASKKPKPGDPNTLVGGEMMVTHIVKNGLLVPVTTAPPESQFYPQREHTDYSSYQKKKAEKIKDEVKKMIGWRRGDWNRGVTAMKDYLKSSTDINRVLSTNMLKKAHPKIINKINSIDKLFQYPKITKIGQDITVYATSGMKPKTGDAFEFNGYLSTTVCPKVACGFIGGKDANPDIMDIQTDSEDQEKPPVPTLIQIDLKKGQRALDAHSLQGGPDYQDKNTPEEFILPRNSRLIIKDGPIYLKHAKVWQAELDQTDDDFEPDDDDLS